LFNTWCARPLNRARYLNVRNCSIIIRRPLRLSTPSPSRSRSRSRSRPLQQSEPKDPTEDDQALNTVPRRGGPSDRNLPSVTPGEETNENRDQQGNGMDKSSTPSSTSVRRQQKSEQEDVMEDVIPLRPRTTTGTNLISLQYIDLSD
jgi:hypothetical protein